MVLAYTVGSRPPTPLVKILHLFLMSYFFFYWIRKQSLSENLNPKLVQNSVLQLPWKIRTEYKSSDPRSLRFSPQRQKHVISGELQAQQVFLPLQTKSDPSQSIVLSIISPTSASSVSPLFCRPKVNYPTYKLLTVKDNQQSELLWWRDKYLLWSWHVRSGTPSPCSN